jgi:hypothetical protein
MIIVDASVNVAVLRIICSGSYGEGSEGNPSGRLVEDTIRRFMECDADPPNEVVIDFTRVEYVWGDGPGWSVMPWARHVKVTYLASDKNERALRGLFSATNLDKVLNITISRVDDA